MFKWTDQAELLRTYSFSIDLFFTQPLNFTILKFSKIFSYMQELLMLNND